MQGIDLVKVLDVCEEKIASACNYTMDSSMEEDFAKCDNMWQEIKNKSESECEEYTTANCSCWKEVNKMKQNFNSKCVSKTLNNATGS